MPSFQEIKDKVYSLRNQKLIIPIVLMFFLNLFLLLSLIAGNQRRNLLTRAAYPSPTPTRKPTPSLPTRTPTPGKKLKKTPTPTYGQNTCYDGAPVGFCCSNGKVCIRRDDGTPKCSGDKCGQPWPTKTPDPSVPTTFPTGEPCNGPNQFCSGENGCPKGAEQLHWCIPVQDSCCKWKPTRTPTPPYE